MKSSLFFIAFLLVVQSLAAQNTWYWYNPYPDGYNLNDVWFIVPDNGWALASGNLCGNPEWSYFPS